MLFCIYIRIYIWLKNDYATTCYNETDAKKICSCRNLLFGEKNIEQTLQPISSFSHKICRLPLLSDTFFLHNIICLALVFSSLHTHHHHCHSLWTLKLVFLSYQIFHPGIQLRKHDCVLHLELDVKG